MADKPKKPSRSKTSTASARKKRSGGGKKTRIASKSKKGSLATRHKILIALASIGFTLLIIALCIFAWFASDLPDIEKMESYTKPPGIRVYDNDDNLIGSFGHVVGKYVPYEQIPKHLIDALLATEDRRFFEHSGVDPFGIIRAMYHNVIAGGVVQGGSTITQQLAKNTFLTPERTYKRKIQEVMLSIWVENHFSKEKILELYLNRVYFGAGNYGIDASAFHYFDKSATEVTLQEAALLVGLLKAPSRYTPTRDKKLSLKRTKQVILNMKDAGMLNDKAASEAISEFDIKISLKDEYDTGSQYFSNWIVDQIPEYVGTVDGDLEVYTSLDPKMQAAGEKLLKEAIAKDGASGKVSQASLLSMSPDGAIQAMIGGVNYSKSQYNRITQSKRQPGSAFKLFVYLNALEKGLTPNSWVVDGPVTFGDWSPKNYTLKYLGDIKLREAFMKSVNTVAVKLQNQFGTNSVINLAKRLGIKEKLSPNLSLALGTSEITMLELVGAYAHLANEGRKVTPYGIRKILNTRGNKVIYEHDNKADNEQIIRTNIVHMMNDMLSDVIAYGTGRGANIGRPAAGKTGTTQNSRDAYFIGFTPQYVTGIWLGNDNNSPTNKITGGALPARIWKSFMEQALQGKPILEIPRNFVYEGNGVDYNNPYNSTGAGLPWREGVVEQGRPNQGLPWERNTQQNQPNSIPNNREIDLPTSRVQPYNDNGEPDYNEIYNRKRRGF